MAEWSFLTNHVAPWCPLRTTLASDSGTSPRRSTSRNAVPTASSPIWQRPGTSSRSVTAGATVTRSRSTSRSPERRTVTAPSARFSSCSWNRALARPRPRLAPPAARPLPHPLPTDPSHLVLTRIGVTPMDEHTSNRRSPLDPDPLRSDRVEAEDARRVAAGQADPLGRAVVCSRGSSCAARDRATARSSVCQRRRGAQRTRARRQRRRPRARRSGATADDTDSAESLDSRPHTLIDRLAGVGPRNPTPRDWIRTLRGCPMGMVVNRGP